jgi:hypothetical protein
LRAALASGLFVIVATLTTLSTGASADETKAACAHGAESGERLRDEGKPLAARTRFLACARPACPAIVRSHCARWLDQIEQTIPTLVVKARVGSAEPPTDVTDVRVAVDGVDVLTRLEGQPLRVEPGAHLLKFTRAGADPVEVQVLVVAGEKNRLVTAEFPRKTSRVGPGPTAGSLAGAGTPSPVVRSEPASLDAATTRSLGSSPSAGSGSIRPAAWAFAGLALAAAGSFAYFGETGKSDLDSLRATCAGHCDSSAVSSAWNKLVVADVSLGVGVVSAAIATWLFVSPRHEGSGERKTVAASGLLLGPRADGFQLGWRGAF